MSSNTKIPRKRLCPVCQRKVGEKFVAARCDAKTEICRWCHGVEGLLRTGAIHIFPASIEELKKVKGTFLWDRLWLGLAWTDVVTEVKRKARADWRAMKRAVVGGGGSGSNNPQT